MFGSFYIHQHIYDICAFLESVSLSIAIEVNCLLHYVGAKVASKLVSDTIHEVKQQNQKDGMKATPQQESYSSENGKSNSQNENENEGGGGHWRSKL